MAADENDDAPHAGELPSIDELCDAEKRERFLARCMLDVASGRVRPIRINAILRVAKEMRENTDLRALTRELDVCRRLFREFLGRKAGVSVDEIEAALRRAWVDLRDAGEE